MLTELGTMDRRVLTAEKIQELFAENAEHTLCTPCVFLCDLRGKNNFYDFADD